MDDMDRAGGQDGLNFTKPSLVPELGRGMEDCIENN